MRKIFFSFLALLCFVGLLSGLCYGIARLENQVIKGVYYSPELLYFYSGWAGFALLFCGLWLPQLLARFVGWLSFAVLCAHVWIFVALDFEFAFGLIAQKICNETPLIFGSLSFFALLIAFGVSLWGCFRLFRMSFCVYFALVCATLHVLMAQKILSWTYFALIFVVMLALGFKFFKVFSKSFSSLSRKLRKKCANF